MPYTQDKSIALFARAQHVIPGGVNSPVRAFRAVEGPPVFLARGQGSRVFDVDGNAYIDYLGSWGPLILGHAHPEILQAINETAALGTSFGMSTAREVEFAERLVRHVPSMEQVRLVSSGTEATMSAVRLARGATGRELIVKVDGGFHGHVDSLLVAAGSGAATFGVPDSAGVPRGLAESTLSIPFNSVTAAEQTFARFGGKIAAMIIEPVAGNMGVVAPTPGYLHALRDLTRAAGSLLIFDEVITGYRLGLGGAQAHYGVTPDLTCLGKIIGGGLPVGAYGGRADLMQQIAPEGPVYQAGTLSGNPLAVAAGLAALTILERDNPYPRLEALAKSACDALAAAAKDAGLPMTVNRVGSMFTGFFTDDAVTDFASAKRADAALYGRYHRQMLTRGVFLAPSQFEATFVSAAHSQADLDATAVALGEALHAVRR